MPKAQLRPARRRLSHRPWLFRLRQPRANPDFVPRDWQRLCLGECDGRLQPGPYRFALSLGAGEPVMAPTLFETTTGGHLEGTYTDRSNRRLAGALILGLGGVASLASITTGTVLATDPYTERVGVATLAGGVVGVLLSLLIGLPLVGSSDEVDITPIKKGAH